MARQLWAYSNEFGWYAVDPEGCQHDRAQVDTLPVLVEAETKHALMAKAKAAGTTSSCGWNSAPEVPLAYGVLVPRRGEQQIL